METYATFLDEYKTVKLMKDMWFHTRAINFALQSLDAGNGDVHQALNVFPGDIVIAAWLKVLTACPDRTTVDFGNGGIVNRWGNAMPLDAVGYVSPILTGSKTFDYDMIEDKSSQTVDLIVDGAAFGDTVIASPSIDIADMLINAAIIQPDTVMCQLANLTGGTLNLGSLVLSVFVNKAPLAGMPWVVTEADTIDIKATKDSMDVNIDSGIVEVNALIVRV